MGLYRLMLQWLFSIPFYIILYYFTNIGIKVYEEIARLTQKATSEKGINYLAYKDFKLSIKGLFDYEKGYEVVYIIIFLLIAYLTLYKPFLYFYRNLRKYGHKKDTNKLKERPNPRNSSDRRKQLNEQAGVVMDNVDEEYEVTGLKQEAYQEPTYTEMEETLQTEEEKEEKATSTPQLKTKNIVGVGRSDTIDFAKLNEQITQKKRSREEEKNDPN